MTATHHWNGLKAPPLTYLATPYSYKHADNCVRKAVQQIRFEACTKVAGWLCSEFGWNVFSPITHSHPMHILYPDIRGDWDFWAKIDIEFIQLSCRFVTLTIPGWRKSIGVTAETKKARELGLELLYVSPHPDGRYRMTKEPLNADDIYPAIGDTDL